MQASLPLSPRVPRPLPAGRDPEELYETNKQDTGAEHAPASGDPAPCPAVSGHAGDPPPWVLRGVLCSSTPTPASTFLPGLLGAVQPQPCQGHIVLVPLQRPRADFPVSASTADLGETPKGWVSVPK